MSALSLDQVAKLIADIELPVHCEDAHHGYSCNGKALLMFSKAFQPVLKTYIPIHIVPFLLFKRKRFVKK